MIEPLTTGIIVSLTVAAGLIASPFAAGAILPALQAKLGLVVLGTGTIQASIIAPLMSFAATGFGVSTTALTSTLAGAIACLI